MPSQGFFAFCTSLQPVERKALGELSRVLHLTENEIIYSPGDPSDNIFIINRGVVEIPPEPSTHGTPSTFLWRDEIFGDLEALMHAPRTQTARTREKVSLQVIDVSDFAELSRRVPPFFPYLCAHLASRLAASEALAFSKSRGLELSGNLENFDLVTIYQTITSSLQTGELAIHDDNGNPTASFFFGEGRPLSAQFRQLTGTEAFQQLFLTDPLLGTFSFHAGEEAFNHRRAAFIEQPQGNLLIRALQARDEFQGLKQKLTGSHKLQRRKLNFVWPAAARPELRALAEEIWQKVYTTPQSLNELYAKCAVSELKIYQTADVLTEAGLLKLEAPENISEEETLVVETTNA